MLLREATIFYDEMMLLKFFHLSSLTLQTLTCSNSTIETLEKSVKLCLKLTLKTLEQHQWRRSGVFIVNFEHNFTPTVWKVSEYGVFAGRHFPVFGAEKSPYLDPQWTFSTVSTAQNSEQSQIKSSFYSQK